MSFGAQRSSIVDKKMETIAYLNNLEALIDSRIEFLTSVNMNIEEHCSMLRDFRAKKNYESNGKIDSKSMKPNFMPLQPIEKVELDLTSTKASLFTEMDALENILQKAKEIRSMSAPIVSKPKPQIEKRYESMTTKALNKPIMKKRLEQTRRQVIISNQILPDEVAIPTCSEENFNISYKSSRSLKFVAALDILMRKNYTNHLCSGLLKHINENMELASNPTTITTILRIPPSLPYCALTIEGRCNSTIREAATLLALASSASSSTSRPSGDEFTTLCGNTFLSKLTYAFVEWRKKFNISFVKAKQSCNSRLLMSEQLDLVRLWLTGRALLTVYHHCKQQHHNQHLKTDRSAGYLESTLLQAVEEQLRGLPVFTPAIYPGTSTEPQMQSQQTRAVDRFRSKFKARVQYLVESHLGKVELMRTVRLLKDSCYLTASRSGGEDKLQWEKALRAYRAMHCLLLDECKHQQSCVILPKKR